MFPSDRTIYNADNLLVMSRMPDECVDLIYLDPPFNTGKQWENPLRESGKKVSFKDTWTLADIHDDEQDVLALRHPRAAAVIDALGYANGGSWSAYLTYMGARLVQMHRVLKFTGAIYYHCDPTMSHGVKLLMDAIFGKDNCRNEIIWCYSGGGVPKGAFARKHDVILAYGKSAKTKFNPQYRPYSESAGYGRKTIAAKEVDWERGATMTDWWSDKELMPLGAKISCKERVGYPTEKPIALLRRILKASSRPGDLVMDPFCGCGVTAAASELFFDDRRRWVGIDIGTEASGVLRRKLNKCAAHLLAGLKVPDVQTLKEADLPPLPPIPQKDETKKILYKGTGGICPGCTKPTRMGLMHIDHIIPRAKGGDNDLSNLQLLCGECNSKKGKRTMNELRRAVAAERIAEVVKKDRAKYEKKRAAELTKAIDKAQRQGRMV
ncbi:MAG: DNA methyltransferase [Gammaproteobacteria bacterium]